MEGFGFLSVENGLSRFTAKLQVLCKKVNYESYRLYYTNICNFCIYTFFTWPQNAWTIINNLVFGFYFKILEETFLHYILWKLTFLTHCTVFKFKVFSFSPYFDIIIIIEKVFWFLMKLILSDCVQKNIYGTMVKCISKCKNRNINK